MNGRTTWLVNGTLVTPKGLVRGNLGIREGRIVSVGGTPSSRDERVSVRAAYVSPGFIDLHLWGEPKVVARDAVAEGTTAFLASIAPTPPEQIITMLEQLDDATDGEGARCLGAHLEGPFLNPAKAGALPKRWMRPPVAQELEQLARYTRHIKLITLSPELTGAMEAIDWCRRHRIVASLGHTDADAALSLRAIDAGASAVTHVFNAMRPFHHRDPGLVGVSLTDDRVTAMAILDGIHTTLVAFKMLMRCKGARGVALVTDSIRRYHHQWQARLVHGAYYKGKKVLAGSALSMIRAVRNAVLFGKTSLSDAVHMASTTPAQLIGQAVRLGSLERGKQADVAVFDRQFRVRLTMVGGRLAYRQD